MLTWHTEKRLRFLGQVSSTDIAQAKATLAAFNLHPDGTCLSGYGTAEAEDTDYFNWHDRDGFVLACFTSWWNNQGREPALPAPISKNYVAYSDLTEAHVQALAAWALESAITISPGQLPMPTFPGGVPPKPPSWPSALPWPVVKPDWYPATAPWPPIGTSWGVPPLAKPADWPASIPWPPPLPGSSGYPYPPFVWPAALWPIPPTATQTLLPLMTLCPAGQHWDQTSGACQPDLPPAQARTPPATTPSTSSSENTGILLAVGGLIVLGVLGAIFASSSRSRARSNDSLNENMSDRCRSIISRTTAEERRAGYPEKQAVAIGYSKARRAGCRIPKRRRRRR